MLSNTELATGKSLGEIPVIIPIIGVKMQGDKMHTGSDALFLQTIDHFVPSDPQPFQVQLNDIEGAHMAHLLNIVALFGMCL